jgi:hypothetical protein
MTDMFDKAPELIIPELPLDKAVAKQPDDVKAIGELKTDSQPPVESRLHDSEVTLVPDPIVDPGQEEESRQAGVFPVRVTQRGGSQGDSSNAASWTYEVRDIFSGEILEDTQNAPLAPEIQRPNIGRSQEANANDFGLAFYDETDTLKLWSVGEAIIAGACP